ncbi:hypothetical protein [uncultured Sphingopyxis sp.]|uniref:hypothetical protein n=1 Tax=uncultured Sphingopyxis sp. TaxID=310581 RepID=UPI0025F501D0|nr:hypothetical protein [uncultured Sphingopyxis sp.]
MRRQYERRRRSGAEACPARDHIAFAVDPCVQTQGFQPRLKGERARLFLEGRRRDFGKLALLAQAEIVVALHMIEHQPDRWQGRNRGDLCLDRRFGTLGRDRAHEKYRSEKRQAKDHTGFPERR